MSEGIQDQEIVGVDPRRVGLADREGSLGVGGEGRPREAVVAGLGIAQDDAPRRRGSLDGDVFLEGLPPDVLGAA